MTELGTDEGSQGPIPKLSAPSSLQRGVSSRWGIYFHITFGCSKIQSRLSTNINKSYFIILCKDTLNINSKIVERSNIDTLIHIHVVFCFSSSCLPYVAIFSLLAIFDCPFCILKRLFAWPCHFTKRTYLGP
jgi:hypothetical protein